MTLDGKYKQTQRDKNSAIVCLKCSKLFLKQMRTVALKPVLNFRKIHLNPK